MNFLGMGPMELMLILVLAMIIFGPGKLPEIAGQVGKVVRDFRRTTSELSSEFNRTLSLEIEDRKATQAPPPPVPPVEGYQAPGEVYQAPVVTSEAVTAPPAVEPAEAPPAPEPAGVVASSKAELAAATSESAAQASSGDGAGSTGEAATRRRNYDADLAPPY